MKILAIAFNELVGMFIDDGALALLSLLLIGTVGFAAKMGYIGGLWAAVILFVGCLFILGESVSRAARKKFHNR